MKFVNNFGFWMSISFRKMFHDFPKIFDKITKIKEHKNFQNFLTRTYRQNWKENVKKIKTKKQVVNHWILKKLFHISIF